MHEGLSRLLPETKKILETKNNWKHKACTYFFLCPSVNQHPFEMRQNHGINVHVNALIMDAAVALLPEGVLL